METAPYGVWALGNRDRGSGAQSRHLKNTHGSSKKLYVSVSKQFDSKFYDLMTHTP